MLGWLSALDDKKEQVPTEIKSLRNVPIKQLAAACNHMLVLSTTGTLYMLGTCSSLHITGEPQVINSQLIVNCIAICRVERCFIFLVQTVFFTSLCTLFQKSSLVFRCP